MKFSRPNLPQNKARVCIVSGKSKPIIHALEQRGITCCLTRPSKTLSAPVADHPDMLMLQLKAGSVILSADQKELFRRLKQFQIKAIPCHNLKPGYPDETLLNALMLDSLLIGGDSALSFINSFETNKCKSISVRQGYARCSVVPVTDRAAITADKGIANALEANGVDVLLIEPETKILLKGYAYGFLGGCCGKISEHELAFFGDFTSLMQHQEIKKFLARFDVEPISLTKEPVQDLGGILTLCEEG